MLSSTQSTEIESSTSTAEWIDAIRHVIHAEKPQIHQRKHDFKLIRQLIEKDLSKHAQTMRLRASTRTNSSMDNLNIVNLSDQQIIQTIAKSRWKFIQASISTPTFHKIASQDGMWDVVALLQNRNQREIPNLHQLISSIKQKQRKEALRVIQDLQPIRIHHESQLLKMLRIVAIQNSRITCSKYGDTLSDLEYKVVSILTRNKNIYRTNYECALIIQLLKRTLPEHSTLFKWIKESDTENHYMLARELEYIPAFKDDIIMWQGTLPDNKKLESQMQNAPHMNQSAYIANQNSDRCYIILNGSVDVYVNKHLQEKNDAIYTSIPIGANSNSNSNDNTQYNVANWWDKGKKVATLNDGTLIGEMSLMYNQPRNATIIAENFSEFLCLRKSIFNIMLKRVTQDIFATIRNDLRKFELFYTAQDEFIKPVLKSFKYVTFTQGQKLQISNQKVKTVYFVLDGQYKEYADMNTRIQQRNLNNLSSNKQEKDNQSFAPCNWDQMQTIDKQIHHVSSIRQLRRSYVLHSNLQHASKNLEKKHKLRLKIDEHGLQPLLQKTIHAVHAHQRKSRKLKSKLNNNNNNNNYYKKSDSPKQVHKRRWSLATIGEKTMIGGYYAWNHKMATTTIECIKSGTALAITSNDLISSMHPSIIPKFRNIVKRDHELVQQRLQLIDGTRKHAFDRPETSNKTFNYNIGTSNKIQFKGNTHNTESPTYNRSTSSPSRRVDFAKMLDRQHQQKQQQFSHTHSYHLSTTLNQKNITLIDKLVAKHNPNNSNTMAKWKNVAIGKRATKTSYRKKRNYSLTVDKLPRVQTAPHNDNSRLKLTGIPKIGIENLEDLAPSKQMYNQRQKDLSPIPSVNRILLAKNAIPEEMYRQKAMAMDDALRKKWKKQYTIMRKHLISA